MFKKCLVAAVVIIISSISSNAATINSTWVGGCCNGYWNDPNNWNPEIVPHNDGENTFNVTIEAYDNYVDVILVEDRIINQLDCNSAGDYDIDLGGNQVVLTFESNNGLTNYGSLGVADLGDIDVEIHGNVTNYNQIVFMSGHVSIEEGDFINNGSAEIKSDSKLYVAQTLSNFGNINISDGKCVVDQALDNRSSGIITGYGEITSYDQFRNDGSLLASGLLYLNSEGSLVNSTTGTLGNKPLATLFINHNEDINNLGTIEVHSGGIAFDGRLFNDTNGALGLYGGTLAAKTVIQTAYGIFRGFGGIAGNTTIDPNGIIKLAGTTNIIGDVEINENATLEISDGITFVTGHTTCNGGTIHMKGGRIIPQGGFIDNNCTIIWEPSLYNNIADFNLDGKINFEDFTYFANSWLWESKL